MGASTRNVRNSDNAGVAHAANNLNNMVPSPLSELPVAKPPSIEVMKCIPAGAESDTNSSIVDSGDEWDKTRQLDPQGAPPRLRK